MGTTTFSVTILVIMTFSITTISIMTFRIAINQTRHAA
jgi:hypothetical protein